MLSAKLTTFVPPRPSATWIRAAQSVNRRLLLSGVPGLRNLPGMQDYPLASGVTRILRLEFTQDSEAVLRAALAPGKITFVAANHPEFFTDWVLAQELAARFAPDMALWVPPQIVNGQFQRFWLRNHFVPSLTGPDANPAKVYSLDWALKGKGVLLHPELESGWHGHLVGPVYPAVAEMALRAQLALERKGADDSARILPLVWKLRFLRDEDDALHREVDYVEIKLGLRKIESERLETRVYGLTEQLLEREEVRCGVLPLYARSFVERWQQLYVLCLRKIFGQKEEFYAAMPASVAARHAQKWSRERPEIDPHWLLSLRWLARFSPHIYSHEVVTQEQLAELIKRIRQDHCEGAWTDRLHQALPAPVGPRVAYLSTAPAIEIKQFRRDQSGTTLEHSRSALTKRVRHEMQTALQALDARVLEQTGYVVYANPYKQ